MGGRGHSDKGIKNRAIEAIEKSIKQVSGKIVFWTDNVQAKKLWLFQKPFAQDKFLMRLEDCDSSCLPFTFNECHSYTIKLREL